jgi:RNA polymerase sigma factor (sigma-70 family)
MLLAQLLPNCPESVDRRPLPTLSSCCDLSQILATFRPSSVVSPLVLAYTPSAPWMSRLDVSDRDQFDRLWVSQGDESRENRRNMTDRPPSGRDGKRDTSQQELAERVYALRGALSQYFGRRVTDASEVDDLVQDVFVRMLRRGALAHSDQLVAYVFQTARSVLVDRDRRRRTRQADRHVALDPDAHADIAPGPEAGLLAREALRASSLALMDLPERTRTIFLLRRLEGMSFSEIARRLGISVSLAEKHVLLAARHLAARAQELPG